MSLPENISVLITNKSLDDKGILTNAAFVIGLTAGHLLPDSTFGPDVVDGDGNTHTYLTNIAHFVRKAGNSKIASLRETFSAHENIHVVDYTEDAAPSTYADYEKALGKHKGEEIVYRALWIYGPSEVIVPLTKSLSKLS